MKEKCPSGTSDISLPGDTTGSQDHERATVTRFHVPLQNGHDPRVLDGPAGCLLAPPLGHHVHESRSMAACIQRGEFLSRETRSTFLIGAKRTENLSMEHSYPHARTNR